MSWMDLCAVLSLVSLAFAWSAVRQEIQWQRVRQIAKDARDWDGV